MWAIDLFVEVFAVVVGVPLQRMRARRLLRSDRGQVVLAYPAPSSALGVPRRSGVATFGPGSIQLGSWRAQVTSVDLPGLVGRDVERQDSRLAFAPKDQIVYRVKTRRGSFDMTLVGVVAEDLISRLRVST